MKNRRKILNKRDVYNRKILCTPLAILMCNRKNFSDSL